MDHILRYANLSVLPIIIIISGESVGLRKLVFVVVYILLASKSLVIGSAVQLLDPDTQDFAC